MTQEHTVSVEFGGETVLVGYRGPKERGVSAVYERAGSLHLVTFNGTNWIFFPDKPGATAFGSEAFARAAAEAIRAYAKGAHT